MNTICQLIEKRASENAGELIFRFLSDGEREEEQLSWKSLHRGQKSIAYYLQQYCQPGERAIVMLPSGLLFVQTMAACLYSSVVAVPVNSARPEGRGWDTILKIIMDSDARFVITTSKQSEKIKEALAKEDSFNEVRVISANELIEAQEDTSYRGGSNLAFLQYTSGSTGDPKGVMVGYENLISNLAAIKNRFVCSEAGCGVIWLPPYHDMGLLGGILQPFYSGVPVVLMPPTSVIQQPALWLKAISKYKATISGGPNFIYEQSVERISDKDLESIDLSSWKNAFSGAEPVRADILQRFAERFGPYGFNKDALYPCYGLAEGTLYVSGPVTDNSGMKVENFNTKALSEGNAIKANSVNGNITLVNHGKPYENQEIIICKADTADVLPEGKVGEIWLKGASVTYGYWNNEKATGSAFNQYTSDNKGPYLRTGDLGFLFDGELYISGRIKDVIIIRGKNHYPQDIENTSQISDAALISGGCVAFADEKGIIIIQEIKRSEIKKINVKEIMKKIRVNITNNHEVSVSKIILIRPGGILKTSSGKVRRKAMQELLLSGKLTAIDEWSAQSASRDQQNNHQDTNRSFVINWFDNWLIRETGEALPDMTAGEILLDNLGIDSLQKATLLADFSDLISYQLPSDIFESHEYLGSFLNELEAIYNFISGYNQLSPELRTQITGQLENEGDHQAFEDIDAIPEEFFDLVHLKGVKEIEARLESMQGVSLPFFTTHEGVNGSHTVMNEENYLNFSNHNYLGLAQHPDVQSASIEAINQYGTSPSAARIVAGQRPVHVDLEAEIAKFTGHEDAITFVSSNFCNVTVIGHLMQRGDLILYDEYSHDSLLQGGKLSQADMLPFAHNNWQMADEILNKKRKHYRKVMLFIEGAYSMDGDIPDLKKFVEIKKKYKALLMVDECLSIGVVGKSGRGVCEHCDVMPSEIDICMGGISKSFASCGGYIAGKRSFITYLRYTTPGFVYTTGMPPAVAASALTAIKVIQKEKYRVHEVQELSKYFINKANALGLDTGFSKDTPVIPLMIGDENKCIYIYQKLRENLINVQPILYPAVPENKARLRLFINYGHTVEDINKVLNIIKEYI
ncbi:aminotransferase class I/II-fold pyridoxal phosphate-dependent enzyme [Photorhabdus namnaonensis]|uniref:Long-chain-fatty-acid--AMP ligase FadD29 n=1 Tax=Photorhabdus namnaonensis TaxID=1851568 RepID=A0A1B8YCZ8_9GAMM|nr:aminotransferase class I/II-fold pyridoxal phosphate-dependent enzyme [Photorhabdus namnaonensis]OCA53031.1 Long-chain-fatty-acid--AMP ligase FadD29 [Photorhabdus namnaonensis]